jgi:flagellar assembly protein FliH
MSSKLYRGGVPVNPVAWPRAGFQDPRSAGDAAPAPVYAPAGSTGASRAQSHLEDAAFQRGIEEGKASARREAAEAIETMNLKLARTVEELAGLRARFRHEAEEDVVALSLAIARRVLHRELTIAPEALLGLVKAALEKMELREVHRVRVSRADAPIVMQYLEKMGLPRPIEVIADPGLQRGSAILDSSRGALDASVETQLAEIERGFADLVRRV